MDAAIHCSTEAIESGTLEPSEQVVSQWGKTCGVVAGL
jgi:hypothetical protein